MDILLGMVDYQHVVAVHAENSRRKKGRWAEVEERQFGETPHFCGFRTFTGSANIAYIFASCAANLQRRVASWTWTMKMLCC